MKEDLWSLALVGLLACGAAEPAPTVTSAAPTAEPEPVAEPAIEAESEPVAVPADREPTRLVVGRRTPIDGSPAIRLVSPAEGAVIRRGPVRLDIRVTDFALAASGNHVHVRVDDGPEMALYAIDGPVDLNALVQEATGRELSRGSHIVRLFLGRPDHESVKRDEARVTRVLHVGARTPGFRFEREAPRLVYSRPQGCSSSRRRLLDFQLENVELAADGYQIGYTVDDAIEGTIDAWVPHVIDNLGRGDHSVALWLLDPAGAVVESSRAERTFVSDDDCPAFAVNAYEPRPSEDPDGADDDDADL